MGVDPHHLGVSAWISSFGPDCKYAAQDSVVSENRCAAQSSFASENQNAAQGFVALDNRRTAQGSQAMAFQDRETLAQRKVSRFRAPALFSEISADGIIGLFQHVCSIWALGIWDSIRYP